MVITGDWHSTFVNDIHQDFDRRDAPAYDFASFVVEDGRPGAITA